MIEDKYLVWKLKRDCRDSLQRIYEKYAGYLLTLATSLLCDRNLAEDVLHDTFVALVEMGQRLRISGNFKSYLATCVMNRARDVMRKRKHTGGCLAEAEQLVAVSPLPESIAVFGEAMEHVAHALSLLPYEQREVVILHLQGGLMFKQIARVKKVSVNTVQSRYRYGMEKLRSMLNDEIPERYDSVRVADKNILSM